MKQPHLTSHLIETVKHTDQDFEWYPTTDQIITIIRGDLDERLRGHHNSPSVLDCGSGDGRVLKALTKGDRYAIEKSRPLLDALDRSIYVVGTEFKEQTLIDKRVDLVFCNPPYSEYAEWAKKIILEANAPLVYLVLPQRWIHDEAIKSVLERRRAEYEVLGTYDFHNADRQARAVVNIVRISLGYDNGRAHHTKVDPFEVWFNEHFKFDAQEKNGTDYERDQAQKADINQRLDQALVKGSDLLSALVKFYQFDLAKLQSNYTALSALDGALLAELDVSVEALRASLRQRIEGLKDRYWHELFDHLSKVTDRLTHDSRTRMLNLLTRHTHVEFSTANAHAVLGWVLKNANAYFDDQLVSLVERMTEQESIRLYRSNQRTFGDEQWRYCRQPEHLNRYGLDLRFVLHRVGGLSVSTWEFERERHAGLEERAYWLIDDLLTVANNLGYQAQQSPRSFEWVSNRGNTFTYYDAREERSLALLEVKAFKNGNLHIKLNQDFLCRLNVEFGRLKGWLKTSQEACDELDVDLAQAEASFSVNLQLGQSSLLALTKIAPDV